MTEEYDMVYLVAILLPPVAFFMVGKPAQGLLSILLCLTILGWVPAAVWALLVVNEAQSERRHQELLEVARRR